MNLLIFLLLTLLMVESVDATIWYVRPNGSDGHNCTQAQTNNDANAKQTIPAALACAGTAGSTAGAGHTVHVAAGLYSGTANQMVDKIPSGLTGNPFTLLCEKDFSCELSPGGTNSAIGWNTASSYIVVRGFKTITGGGWYFSAGSRNVHHHIEILFNEWDGTAMAMDAMGVQASGAGNITLRGNRVHHLDGRRSDGIQGYSHAFYPSEDTNDWIIEDNLIHTNGAVGIHVYSATAGKLAENFIIRRNIAYLNGSTGANGAGILVEGGAGHRVFANLVFNNAYAGILLRGVEDAQVHFNTAYINGWGCAGDPVCGGIVQESGVNSATFTSNLSIDNSVGQITGGNQSGGNITTGSAASHFVNAASLDFRLVGTSSAIGAGAALGAPYNVDLAGTSRPQDGTWDASAYEFISGTIPACSVPTLVASYSADGNANDSTGTNHGSLGSGVTYTSGKYGQAWTFAGTGGVSVPDAVALDFFNGFSLGAWVKPTVITSPIAIIVKNTSFKYFLYASTSSFCGANAMVGGYNQGGIVAACYSTPLSLDTWAYVEISYIPPTLTLRKDGSVLSTATGSAGLDATTGTLQIGTSDGNEHFTGQIDNVRLYNCGISTSQHISDMNTPLGTPNTPYGFRTSGTTKKIGPGVDVKIGLVP